MNLMTTEKTHELNELYLSANPLSNYFITESGVIKSGFLYRQEALSWERQFKAGFGEDTDIVSRTEMTVKIKRFKRDTIMDMIVDHAKSSDNSPSMFKILAQQYDDIAILCTVRAFFGGNSDRVIRCTARALFEITSLDYNYTIISYEE